jgi:uncharacterized repeat protein (TIGR03803 family)
MNTPNTPQLRISRAHLRAKVIAAACLVLVFATGAATQAQAQAPTFTVLHSFDGTDGSAPYAALVQATDGNFYGTTSGVGPSANNGTAFKITPNGTLTTLYSFCSLSSCADGTNPLAALVQATDGNFYGTTPDGGANGYGTVFKLTAGGTLTPLHSFNVTDGAYPRGGLVQGTDGNFYGTTSGTHPITGTFVGFGTVFNITPSGTLTTLHSFDFTDGYFPSAGPVQATDGNFYGTTAEGGANGDGTVFSLSVGLGPPPTPTCPLSQGFRKNHGSQWPVTSLTLGGRVYTQSQLLTILQMQPLGDASVIPADQLISTKLDIANGSDPAPVSAAVAAGDSKLAAVGPLPAGIKTNTATGQAMTATAATLDGYNNDQLTQTCTAFKPSGPASP